MLPNSSADPITKNADSTRGTANDVGHMLGCSKWDVNSLFRNKIQSILQSLVSVMKAFQDNLSNRNL